MNEKPNLGKFRRMQRLFSAVSGKIVLVPLDDSLIDGPTQGLEILSSKVELIVQNPPDAIMGFAGLFRNFSNLLSHIPAILNLTASTIRSQHTRKKLIGTVKQALTLGMDAVAVHVNLTSRFEPEMLSTLGAVADECYFFGMPLLGIMYPRSEKEHGDENYDDLKQTDRGKYTELVAHAARVGIELGADIIKTQYTGDSDSFRFVVEACDPVPVIVAGGPIIEVNSMLQIAYDVVTAGGAGISFGRNVFSRSDPRSHILALRAIVHDRISPETALRRYKCENN